MNRQQQFQASSHDPVWRSTLLLPILFNLLAGQYSTADKRFSYKNIISNQITFKKPEQFMSPLELALFKLDWLEKYTGDRRKFYLNKKTGKSTWDCPREWQDVIENHRLIESQKLALALKTPLPQSKPKELEVSSLELALSKLDWEELVTKDGKSQKYYWNRRTRKKTWDCPKEWKKVVEQHRLMEQNLMLALKTPLPRPKPKELDISDLELALNKLYWKKSYYQAKDGTKREYYWHMKTRKSTWDCPDEWKAVIEKYRLIEEQKLQFAIKTPLPQSTSYELVSSTELLDFKVFICVYASTCPQPEQCPNYHSAIERRRKITADGKTYCRRECEGLFDGIGVCEDEFNCYFAHTSNEIKYHPLNVIKKDEDEKTNYRGDTKKEESDLEEGEISDDEIEEQTTEKTIKLDNIVDKLNSLMSSLDVNDNERTTFKSLQRSEQITHVHRQQQKQRDLTTFSSWYKLEKCPIKECNTKLEFCHDYHSSLDKRRACLPIRDGNYSYKPMRCPRYFDREYGDQCQYGDQCHFSHNCFEIDFHPAKYRTVICDNDNLMHFKNRLYCPHIHYDDQEAEKDLLKQILELDGRKFGWLCNRLAVGLSTRKRKMLTATVKVETQTDGWEEVGWNLTTETKKKVVNVVLKTKQKMKASKITLLVDLSKKLNCSSLQNCQISVRKITEELANLEVDKKVVERDQRVIQLSRFIKRDVNWACHAKEGGKKNGENGEKKYQVTPVNQMAVAQNFDEFIGVLMENLGKKEE